MAKGGSTAWALKWAARGFRVFPLMPGTKDQPRDMRWYDSATSDPAKVVELFSGAPNWNIAVDCSGQIVVDVDNKNGKDGSRALLDLDLPFEALQTLAVRTPSGGFHYYFTGPKVANSAGKLGRGLDVRGYHGYVVAPGSQTSQGIYQVYQDAPTLEAPEALVSKCSEPRERKRLHHEISYDDDIALKAAEAYLGSVEGATQGEHGDQDTYNVACRLKDVGVSELTAFSLMADLWNNKCSPPWDLAQLEVKVTNAYLYGTSALGIGHPREEFHGVDIPEVVAPGRHWVRHGAEWNRDTRWLFYGILPATGLAILTGPPGAGKTFLATHLAEKLATGDPFFGETADDIGGTIFLAAEGYSSLGPRLSVLGAGLKTVLPIVGTATDPLFDRSAKIDLLRDMNIECDRIEEEHNVPVRMVVLDTLSASGLIIDENNNTECAKAMKWLEQVGRELDLLFLVLHHPPKNGGGLRGGSAILASVDYVLEIEPVVNQHIKRLKLTKARDAEQRTLGGFGLTVVKLCTDNRGRDITTCVVQTSTHAVHAGQTPAHYGIFLDCFDWVRTNKHDPIPVDKLEDVFMDRNPGASPKASKTAFLACRKYAIDSHVVDVLGNIDGQFLIEKPSLINLNPERPNL